MRVFAAGLAGSVREHGGAKVQKALLAGTADPHDWVRGRPVAVKTDLEAQMLAVLRRRKAALKRSRLTHGDSRSSRSELPVRTLLTNAVVPGE